MNRPRAFALEWPMGGTAIFADLVEASVVRLSTVKRPGRDNETAFR